MAEWTEYTIGEVAQVFDGPHATPKKTAEGPWFLSISSLNQGRLNLTESAHLSEEDFVRWTRRVTPREGDLLFSYETRLGEAALMPSGVRACLGRRMGLLRPDQSIVEPRFLLYAYLAPDFQKIIATRQVHGATVDRIPLVDLPSWPITLPPLREQKEICTLLGALDDKIAINERIAATADNLMRAYYQEIENSAIQSIRIGELGKLVRDTVPTSSLIDAENYIGLEHMPRRNMWLSSWDHSAELASAKSAFIANDVLFGKLRPYFHKVGIALTSGVCSTDILVVRPKRPEYLGWLLLALSSDEVVAHASAVGDGTRMPRAKWKDLESFEVSWPGVDEATRIDSILRSVAQRVQAAVEESRVLATLRETLLPQLMSGRLRVRDAEKIVEDAT